MALERKTRLEAIQIADDGTLMLRMKKSTVLDGEVLKEEWYRTAVPPGTDANQQAAAVNAHLASDGFLPVSARDIGLVKHVEREVHTQAVKDAYAAKVARGK